MRCKCGFNSFDHNLACPRCHRDLTATRRLLNLDIPAPGVINFFQIAGQRTVTPQPFLGAGGSGEDFGEYLDEELQSLEYIQPLAHDSGRPLSVEETTPGPPQVPPYAAPAPLRVFAAPLVPVEAVQAEEPFNGIEAADDFGVDQPRSGSRARTEADYAPVNPLSAHLAAMDQIKSTLTETGDLIPEAARPGEGGGDDLSD
jgi:hypothetical protein